jgi:hypothetical protein
MFVYLQRVQSVNAASKLQKRLEVTMRNIKRRKMKALKVTVDWAEMDLFAATLKELNDDENIFAYQIDALTGIVVCENECGLAYCRSCFDYRVTPTIEELR